MKVQYKLSSDNLWNDINRDFENNGGTYRMFAKENDQVLPIGRLLGKDEQGTLYIGKATRFLDRVIDLRKTLDPDYKTSTHICGRRYNKNPSIQESFPFSRLYIELARDDRPGLKESELIQEYFERYGEVPPLNAI